MKRQIHKMKRLILFNNYKFCSELKLVEYSMMEGQEKMIRDAMKKAGKPVRPGDLAKITGLESKEVSKIIKSLKTKGKVIVPKRCYYAPA